MRLFLAFDIPLSFRLPLEEVIGQLKRSGGVVRWVDPASIHLTLAFFGESDEAGRERIERVMGEVFPKHDPIALTFQGLGTFPGSSGSVPRVVWVGLNRSLPLETLYRDLSSRFASVGFPPEERTFSPHLTIGRVKAPDGVSGLRKAVEERKNFSLGTFQATEGILFKSTLTPRGACYEALTSVKLGVKP